MLWLENSQSTNLAIPPSKSTLFHEKLIADPQLLFKPKTAKTAIPTPVLVVALETTETSSGAIGKLLNLKELRLASEDLIKQVLPTAASKDDVSPLPLASIPSTLFLLLDQALATSDELHAVHMSASSSTVLLKGTEIKAYLESLKEGEGEGVKVVDFSEFKSEPKEEKKPAA